MPIIHKFDVKFPEELQLERLRQQRQDVMWSADYRQKMDASRLARRQRLVEMDITRERAREDFLWKEQHKEEIADRKLREKKVAQTAQDTAYNQQIHRENPAGDEGFGDFLEGRTVRNKEELTGARLLSTYYDTKTDAAKKAKTESDLKGYYFPVIEELDVSAAKKESLKKLNDAAKFDLLQDEIDAIEDAEDELSQRWSKALQNARKELKGVFFDEITGEERMATPGEIRARARLLYDLLQEPFPGTETVEEAPVIGVDPRAEAGVPSDVGEPEDRIRVRVKATGRTGNILASEFDPDIYEKI